MRMKMVCDDRTLAEVANEFLALKKAQKVRERTLNDYKKYIDKFLEQSQNSLDVDVLKIEILEYFADIPKTSPARFNHPYQYLHALFAWAAKQDYIPYNPFEKLELKKVRDEGNVQPAEIRDIQTLLKALDKHNYTELRDYNIIKLTSLLPLLAECGFHNAKSSVAESATRCGVVCFLAVQDEILKEIFLIYCVCAFFIRVLGENLPVFIWKLFYFFLVPRVVGEGFAVGFCCRSPLHLSNSAQK